MAQELLVVLVCDGCMLFDGQRVTDDVETIIVPYTKAELDGCPACRERLRPILDLIQKRARVPANDNKPGPGRPRGSRAALPRTASQLSINTGEQDWGIISSPPGYGCEWCSETPGSSQAWASHTAKIHPDKCKTCVVCSKIVTNPYSHYLNQHPEVERPPGVWRGEVRD